MVICENNIKTSYSDKSGFYVYTLLTNFGRLVLEENIKEEHLQLRRKHWIKILNKVIAGDIVDKLEVLSA